jgi:hypothetical protein
MKPQKLKHRSVPMGWQTRWFVHLSGQASEPQARGLKPALRGLKPQFPRGLPAGPPSTHDRIMLPQSVANFPFSVL